MKVVLDTNIWLSAIFWKGEASKIIELGADKKFEIIINQNILSGIAEVLNKESKFQRFIEEIKQKIEDLIRTILSFCTLIDTKSKLDFVKTHQKDNIILEAALDGKADYIISYDNHLLNMIEFRGIRILKPDEFLKENY